MGEVILPKAQIGNLSRIVNEDSSILDQEVAGETSYKDDGNH